MSVLLALVAAFALGDVGAVTVVVGATLVDGGGRAPVADAVVIFRGDVIAAVGDRVHTPIPKGASLVDGRRAWIAPAPATAEPAEGLVRAIVALVRGPVARVQAGQPAHLALLDGDPRPDGAMPLVRRVWLAGRVRESAARAVP